jgi:hypothetical protein
MAANRRMAAEKQPGDHDVGYGRPPKHSQFKPGQSGNPRGRPKGARNKGPAWLKPGRLDALIRDEAYRPITINDNGRPVTVPVMQAYLRRVSFDALQGQSGAQKILSELVGGLERRDQALHERYQEAMIQYKNDGSRHLEECRRAHVAPPDMVPHPDDILIDMSTGVPTLHGPMTPEDKFIWEIVARRRDDARRLLSMWEVELESCESAAKKRTIRTQMKDVSAQLRDAVDQVGEWPHHRVSASGDALKKLRAMLDANGVRFELDDPPARRSRRTAKQDRATADASVDV